MNKIYKKKLRQKFLFKFWVNSIYLLAYLKKLPKSLVKYKFQQIKKSSMKIRINFIKNNLKKCFLLKLIREKKQKIFIQLHELIKKKFFFK